MWAVVEIKRKQYLVKEGEILKVERIRSKEGQAVFEKVLLLADGDKIKVGKPYVAKSQVKAEVLKEEKGDKILVYKVKRRKKYRKMQGHRQIYTVLKISSIS
ncbi:MAG: 50S ribosomal protein L21 [Candidatus Omnitrophica bacterium]|nr:50S ribosomal protein L21 [Candidatus Omnitrophota bacterium]MDD5081298.1 50S ribosomal protein L21 [Candidatus Omnitrophota bacterium]MDD5441424.1 50S ribosomal protein L21 [Candidatus Omnitrophota bacterium]